MKVCLVQFTPLLCRPGLNRLRISRLLFSLQAGDADIVVLPEMAFTGYNLTLNEIKDVAESEKGPTYQWCRDTALRLNAYVAAGYPQVVCGDDGQPDRYYNSMCFVGRDGSLLTTYHKTFLYDTDKPWATAGAAFQDVVLPDLGRVALGICMDLNPFDFVAPFDLFEFAKFHQNADLIIFSAAWLHPSQSRKRLASTDDIDSDGDVQSDASPATERSTSASPDQQHADGTSSCADGSSVSETSNTELLDESKGDDVDDYFTDQADDYDADSSTGSTQPEPSPASSYTRVSVLLHPPPRSASSPAEPVLRTSSILDSIDGTSSPSPEPGAPVSLEPTSFLRRSPGPCSSDPTLSAAPHLATPQSIPLSSADSSPSDLITASSRPRSAPLNSPPCAPPPRDFPKEASEPERNHSELHSPFSESQPIPAPWLEPHESHLPAFRSTPPPCPPSEGPVLRSSSIGCLPALSSDDNTDQTHRDTHALYQNRISPPPTSEPSTVCTDQAAVAVGSDRICLLQTEASSAFPEHSRHTPPPTCPGPSQIASSLPSPAAAGLSDCIPAPGVGQSDRAETCPASAAGQSDRLLEYMSAGDRDRKRAKSPPREPPRKVHVERALSRMWSAQTQHYWLRRLTPLIGHPCTFIAANRTGVERGVRFAGSSCVISLEDVTLMGALDDFDEALMIVEINDYKPRASPVQTPLTPSTDSRATTRTI